jgi:hypothetical protein
MVTNVSPVDRNRREVEYWAWAGGALVLLLSVVPLTAIAAATGSGHYAGFGPLMRWVFDQGLAAFVGVHLATAAVAILLFHVLIQTIERAAPPYDRVVALAFEVWVGLLVSAGLFLFVNNVSFLVTGAPLV